MKTRFGRLMALPILLLFGAACAGTADVEPIPIPGEQVVTVQVANELAPGTIAAVSAEQRRNNASSELGTVHEGEWNTFYYEPEGLRTGTYRLIAETTDGRRILSDTFELENVGTVQWELAPNELTLER